MCGIAGIVGQEREQSAQAMSAAISHRGPDDHGAWSEDTAGLVLLHRRLAIVDLSADGHQPMHSSRYVIVFNGEVYNFLEIRRELESAYWFHSRSDTEVMLAAFEKWGVEAAVPRFNGMFAFVVWDKAERRLWLCRDRLGKKPLYYGWIDSRFFFASELRAIRAVARPPINRRALSYLLQYGYIPAPVSIFEGVYKLPPATLLELSLSALHQKPSDFSPADTPRPYWSLTNLAQRSVAQPFLGTSEEAEERLHALISDAVRLRLVADVPLGAFLSSGIDSSLVVALMQAQGSGRVRTYCVGFREAEYDEAPRAREIAQRLGTEHTEFYLDGGEALALVPKLPAIFDEPFADPSLLPTHLVSKLARRYVTVSLTGDGGDELFAGYNRYLLTEEVFRAARRLPFLLSVLRRLQQHPRLEALFLRTVSLGAHRFYLNRGAEKISKAQLAANSRDEDDFYERLISYFQRDEEAVLGVEPNDKRFLACFHEISDFVQRAQFADLATYLPDDNLAKVDRASMSVALETRAPLLDYRVVEFACSLSTALKTNARKRQKHLLRQLLLRYLPADIVDRPKIGFSVPIGAWLRGPLRAWAEDLIREERLRRDGYFSPTLIRRKWDEHQRGIRDCAGALWCVLMFQAWQDQ